VKEEKNKGTHTANWMAIGISFGLMFGMLFDNMALGMIFGLMFGLGIGSAMDAKERNAKGDDD
jgi:F0F1-type ATP synthase assembly protein I